MRRPLAIAGASLLAISLISIIIADRRTASAQAPASMPTKHFLEVGHTYTFGMTNGSRSPGWKILEGPRDNWVKVSIPDDGQGNKPLITWVNFNQYNFIIPESKSQ